MTSKTTGTVADPVPRNRYSIFLLVAAMGLAVDLATKSWIFAKLWPPPPNRRSVIWIWEPHFGFEVTLNKGALFGMGQGYVWVFVILSFVALLGIWYWLFIAREAHHLGLTIALGGITGGILGNLYDRLGLHGLVNVDQTTIYAVRDWILLQWNDDLRWPNFNIADSLLVCGAAVLFGRAFLPVFLKKGLTND